MENVTMTNPSGLRNRGLRRLSTVHATFGSITTYGDMHGEIGRRQRSQVMVLLGPR